MKNSSALDSFLKQIKTSNYYCQPINIDLKFQNFDDISIKPPQNREHQFITKIPQIKFSLSQQIISKLNQDIAKSRKTKNGLIAAYENIKFKHKMQKIHYFTQNDEQDIGVWQQTEDAFCVGFIVQKQGSYDQFKKRLTSELKKCLQKILQQVVYAKHTHSHDSLSELNPIQKILYKHFRFYLIAEPMPNNSLLVNRIMYYPDAKFLIKPIKLVPAKFTANKVYEQVLSFKSKYDYGYLSLSNTATRQRRFLLIDKFDPQLNQNPPPMIGAWLSAQKFQSKQQMKSYAWALIMQYLRNPSLKLKLSINFQNSGLLFTIQRPQKITAYMFQILEQPKWSLKYSSQNTFRMPQQYVFNDQQIIVQEDKQQSDIESIQNKSIMKNNQSFNNYLSQNQYTTNSINGANNISSGIAQSCDLSKSSVDNKSIKSSQDKELQIKFLKKQLQFYKNRCQMLQKMVNNPAIMQIQAMQMLNPLTNPLAFNNPLLLNQLQQNSIPNQQMNFMSQMMNPSMNMMNYQNNLNQNNLLTNSRSSSNTQKVLNESDLYEEQVFKVPQPVPINNELAFNKKKTFEQQRTFNAQQTNKNNLKKKQSCPVSLPSQQQQKNKLNPTQLLNQFPSQQDIQMSPNGKKHYYDYDYKNISFAQQNSFDNDLNSTHKFASFQANQSQIYGKSPDFKNNFNFNNNFEKENDVKGQNCDKQNKNTDFRNYREFSFDKKDQDFLSSKNSKPSPQKTSTKIFQQDQQGDYDEDDCEKVEKNFISKFQMKYNRQYEGNKQNVKKLTSKKQIIQDSPKIKQRVSPVQKIIKKQSFKQEKISPKNNIKNQSSKIQSQKIDRNKLYEGQIGVNSKKSQQKDQEPQRVQYVSTQINSNKYKSNYSYKATQKQNKKQQQSPIQKNDKNTIKQSKVRQTVQKSDSDSSDQQLRNIAMKYKK